MQWLLWSGKYAYLRFINYFCTKINFDKKMNIVWVGIVALIVNIPLGKWRTRYKKFTIVWWLLIHASIPLVIALRIWLDTPKIAIPIFIGLAVIGQIIGSKILATDCKKH
jgi:hypothetical protein